MGYQRRADGRLVCPFDHHSADFAQRYANVLDEMRSIAPLVWSDCYGGYWIVTSHELVRRFSLDHETFTVYPGEERATGIFIPAPPSKTRMLFVPGEVDGVEHATYRSALGPAFTKRKIEELAPSVRAHVARTIDAILEKQEFDVVADLAKRVLTAVACQYLGLEVEDSARFTDEVREYVTAQLAADQPGFAELEGRFAEAWRQIPAVIAARRQAPQDDVISRLCQLTDPAFSDQEIESMVLNVILGAGDTTTTLITQSVLFLDQNRNVRDLLASRPDQMSAAVEEFLRLLSPAQGNARTATADVEIDGVTIKTGDRVLLSYTAANHDPQKYQHPYSFDLSRGSAQHLGFGAGTHFCLGAWFARAVAAETLTELLRRLPDYRVDSQRAVPSADRSVLAGWATMPAYVNSRTAGVSP